MTVYEYLVRRSVHRGDGDSIKDIVDGALADMCLDIAQGKEILDLQDWGLIYHPPAVMERIRR